MSTAVAPPGLQAHYTDGGLLERILAGLREAGLDSAALTPDDLAPVDQFHTRGRAATRELAELAEFPSGTRVLDVGSGLGGPARTLARHYGCDVTGVELMAEFVAVAAELSRMTGMAERTRFRQGNALALPVPDATADAVWTFQAQMNVADKHRFYGEIARVLRPGGRLAFQDVLAGDGGAFDFPVPWATEPAHSHLATTDTVRGLLGDLGLREERWRDVTAVALDAQEPPTAAPPPVPPLGIHLVLGPRHAEKRANASRALREGHIVIVQGVFTKPN